MSAFFLIAAAAAVASGLGLILFRSPVHQVIALVTNFLALSVLYLSLDAEFIAITQIIVYAGAVMVLFLFVIALLTVRVTPGDRPRSRLRGQEVAGSAIGVGLMLALAAVTALSRSGAGSGAPAGFGGVRLFGQELLTTHVLPFELTAFVLMVAVIGVVILVGRPHE